MANPKPVVLKVQPINIRLVYKRIKEYYGHIFGKDFPPLKVDKKEGFKSAFISLPLINSDNNKSFSLDFYIASSNRPYLNSVEISMCFDVPKDRVISSEELNELNADKFEYKYVQDFEIEDFSMTMYYHIVMNTKMAFFIIDDFAMEDFNHEQLTNLQNKYQD